MSGPTKDNLMNACTEYDARLLITEVHLLSSANMPQQSTKLNYGVISFIFTIPFVGKRLTCLEDPSALGRHQSPEA